MSGVTRLAQFLTGGTGESMKEKSERIRKKVEAKKAAERAKPKPGTFVPKLKKDLSKREKALQELKEATK